MTKDIDQEIGQGKTCTKCGEWKPLDEYYARESSKDGFRNDCKECMKSRTRQFRVENLDHVKSLEKKTRVKNADSIRERDKKYRQENKE